MIVEGVRYFPFVIRFTLADGRRRRWVRWAPGRPWIGEQFDREVSGRDIDIKPGSNVYISEMAPEPRSNCARTSNGART